MVYYPKLKAIFAPINAKVRRKDQNRTHNDTNLPNRRHDSGDQKLRVVSVAIKQRGDLGRHWHSLAERGQRRCIAFGEIAHHLHLSIKVPLSLCHG